MAASKKKRVEDEMTEHLEDDMEYESDDDDESDEEEAMEGEVQLDFEARVPEDCDFNGMRTLLQQVFLKANIDISEMTNTLISQNYVGSVIKQPDSAGEGDDDANDDDDDDDDDDDTVLALTSVLNLTERKELGCIKQLKSMLLDRCEKCGLDKKNKLDKILSDPDHHDLGCIKQLKSMLLDRCEKCGLDKKNKPDKILSDPDHHDLGCIKQLKSMLLDRCEKCGLDKKNKLDKILSDPDHHVGYLISERYLNLPPTLALPMFESLIKEMEKATQKNMKYKFDYYLMICKTFEMKMGHNKRELYFSNSEEEFFQNASDFWFRYSVANERDGVVEKWSAEEDMEPFRTVLVFSADKLQTVIGKIKEELAKT